MNKNTEFDQIDLQILGILLEDANRPFTEVAKQVGVSDGTVHLRVRKMRDMGIVQGSSLLIDYSKLGWDIVAFLGIYLDKSSLYDPVADALAKVPEIVSLHYTTGNYGIFSKIVCRDTNHLRQVLHDKIQKIPGIQRTETFISLEESLNRNVDLQNFNDRN